MSTFQILDMEVTDKVQTMTIFDGKTTVFVWCGQAYQQVQSYPGTEVPCGMRRCGGKTFWAKNHGEFFAQALGAYKRPAIRSMLAFVQDEFNRAQA